MKPPREPSMTRIARLAALVVTVLAGLSAPLYGQARGVLITKPSKAHSDGTARVIPFRSIVEMGAISRFFLPDGQKLDLDFQAVKDCAMYPDFAQPILDARQLGPVENNIREYERLKAKYPQSARVLDPQIQIAKEMILKVKEGNVLLNGEWMNRAQYDALISGQNDKLKMQHELSVERRKLQDEDRERAEVENHRKKR